MELVTAPLGAIYTAVHDMHESRELCQDVYERLRFIVEKLQWMEFRRLHIDAEVVRKLQGLEKDFLQFLEKHGERTWVYRIVMSKHVLQQVGDFQRQIETLMLMLNVCNHAEAAAERVKMERFRKDQETLIASRLTNDATIALEMAREELQVEALSVLRHEFNSGMTAFEQLTPSAVASADPQVLETALRKVMRYSTVAVEQLPAWFLPLSRVEINPTPFAGGSFGQVHHGRMGSLDVVVKRLAVDTRTNKNSTARFRDEASLWFGLHHKHVLKMYGACDVSSPPFIVCERAAYGNLSDFLSDERHCHVTLRLLFEAAQGLAFLHENRVVHADLKCDNILVMADQSAKIADFSFSFVRALSESKSCCDPVRARKAGAVRWRAPECLRGRSPTFASDVYSFGMCIVEAVSREFPWGICIDEGTVRDLVWKGVLPSKPAVMTEPMWSLVTRMCSSEPASRPSMHAVVEELRGLATRYDGAGSSSTAPSLYPRLKTRAETWQPSTWNEFEQAGCDVRSQRSQSAPTFVNSAQQPAPHNQGLHPTPGVCVGKCASYVTFELFPNQMLGVTLVEPKGELVNRGVGITNIVNPWLANTLQEGDLIVAIGSYNVHRLTFSNAVSLIHKLPRPITITFEKSNGRFVYEALPQSVDAFQLQLEAFSVVFDATQTGLVLEDSSRRGIGGGGAVVQKVKGLAKKCGQIAVGDFVYKVNDTLLLKLPFAEAVETIRNAALPKTLHFVPASKAPADLRRFIACA